MRWSLFLIKLQAWWCSTFTRKKTLAQAFSCKCSEIFKKTYFVEHVRTDRCLSGMIQKIVLRKSFYKKTQNIGVLFSAIADMWVYSFSKRDWCFDASQMPFYEYCEVLQNIIFTEQCCTTASDFLWHFQCITCFISDKSVSHSIILVLYQYSQPAITCSKLTIETLEQGVKYVQS